MIVQDNGSIGDRWASTPGKSIWAILLLSEQRMHVQPEMFLNIEQQALQTYFMSRHIFVFDLETKDNWQQATLSEFNRKATDHAHTSKAMITGTTSINVRTFRKHPTYSTFIAKQLINSMSTKYWLTPNPKFIVNNSRSNLFRIFCLIQCHWNCVKLLAKSKYPSSFTL